jgi:hypothetical protein
MEFWRMTPRQFYREVRAFQARFREDRERQLAQAWESAALIGAAMAGHSTEAEAHFPHGH